MHFKVITFTLMFFIACSSSSEVDSQAARVGTLPVKATTTFSSSSSSGSQENTAIMLNERYGQILEIQIEPFELKSKLDIPGRIKAKSLLVGPGAGYFLVIGDENFAIIRADGSADLNPIDIFGKITSAAFDREGGRLVVQDSYDSTGLIKISAAGEITRSWVGGPLLDNKGAVEAGAILPGGPLVLSRSDGQLAVVNFEASIEKEKWSFDVFDPEIPIVEDESQGAVLDPVDTAEAEEKDETGDKSEAENVESIITWLSPVGNARHVLGRSHNQVVLIDVVEQKLIKSVTPKSIIGHFDQAVGHVISQETATGVYRVYWGENGQLKDQLMKLGGGGEIRTDRLEYLSILNTKEDALSLTYGPHGNYEKVFRIRLSDSRVLSINDTPLREGHNVYSLKNRKAVLAVSDRHLLYLHYNSLGKVERRSLGKGPEPLLIKGFNFEEAQQRW